MAGVPLYREASDSRPAAVECQGDSMPRVSDARLATALVVWKARRVGQHWVKFSVFQCFGWLVRRDLIGFRRRWGI